MQQFIASYGVLAVFLLMTAESACIPIPSEPLLLFSGALSARAVPGAHPALVWVFAAGVAGNLVGGYLAWAVGRHAGPAAVHRARSWAIYANDSWAHYLAAAKEDGGA